jgi:acyl-CoA synthetase (AMP-forming)/AMP-acid ligase II
MIHAQLEKSPERPALAFIDFEGEFSWSSMETVYGRATGHAAVLADQGLGQGDVCILNLQSDEFCSDVLIATLLLGAKPLLVAPPTIQVRERYSSLMEVLGYIIRKTKPRIVVAPEEMADMPGELKDGMGKTRFLFGQEHFRDIEPTSIPMVTPAEADIAALQLTSGTTGAPRVCVWRQKGVVAALDGMVPAMDIQDDDICLNWTPLYHDMGLVNNFFLCLTKGIPLAMMSPIDFVRKPALWLRSLYATRSTVTWSPNFGFAITAERARDDELEGIRLDGVRQFWNAAERIHLETIEAFYRRFEPFKLRWESLKTNFGLAENVGGATFSDPHGSFLVEEVDALELQEKGVACRVENSAEEQRTMQVVGVGRPCPGMEVKILSRTGKVLPDGHVGEVALKTPSRMDGYLGQKKETQQALFEDLLRTGDVGYVRGNELFWLGRTRERITTLGKKLDPSDFERVLLKIPNLQRGRFAVFGVDDPKLGTQRIVVVTEVRDPASPSFSDVVSEIRSQVYLQLGVKVYDVLLVPKGILTKTSSGKRRHRYFRQLYMDGELQSLRLSTGGE